MLLNEASRLAQFSSVVRESTIKRLMAMPGGKENWRPVPDAMSPADLARHLIDCDLWLFEKLKTPDLASIRGNARTVLINNREEYLEIMKELVRVGEMRAMIIRHLSDKDLAGKIYDDRVPGEVEVWWLIVRGNLDHEIHHRGQLALFLTLMTANTNPCQ